MAQNRHFTTHSPDTCNCVYSYFDDTTDAQGNVIHEANEIVKLCSLHATVTDKKEHIKTIKKEQYIRSRTLAQLIESLPVSVVDLDNEGNRKLDTIPLNIIEYYTGEGTQRSYTCEFELIDNARTLALKQSDKVKMETDFITKIKADLEGTKNLEGNTFTIDKTRDITVIDKKQNNKKLNLG